jgi:hypothetical protein
LQGCDFSLSLPRVARGAQPWAESFNPIGIEKPDGANQNISRYSTENVEEPKKLHKFLPLRSRRPLRESLCPKRIADMQAGAS